MKKARSMQSLISQILKFCSRAVARRIWESRAAECLFRKVSWAAQKIYIALLRNQFAYARKPAASDFLYSPQPVDLIPIPADFWLEKSFIQGPSTLIVINISRTRLSGKDIEGVTCFSDSELDIRVLHPVNKLKRIDFSKRCVLLSRLVSIADLVIVDEPYLQDAKDIIADFVNVPAFSFNTLRSSSISSKDDLKTIGRRDFLRRKRNSNFIAKPGYVKEGELSFAGESVVVGVAGHEFKFLQEYLDHLYSFGIEVLVDNWFGHAKHDKTLSELLISRCDIIFCEWGLGNAVWYSHKKQKNQRLIVRIHAQELRTDFLSRINVDAVDRFICISELVRTGLIISFQIPSEKIVVIPNFVSLGAGRHRNSQSISEYIEIALVGALPRIKRLDLAIDLILMLYERGLKCRLTIKGKRPYETPWLENRASEQQFFANQLERIEKIGKSVPSLIRWESHSPSIEGFYADKDYVLSLSDRESFHFSVIEGAIGGAKPLILAWRGVEEFYPEEWQYSSLREIADHILRESAPERVKFSVPRGLIQSYGTKSVFHALDGIVLGDVLRR